MARSSGIPYKLLVIGTYLVLQTLSLVMLSRNEAFRQAGLVRAVQGFHYRLWESGARVRTYFLLGRTNATLSEENARLRTELAALQAIAQEALGADTLRTAVPLLPELATPDFTDGFTYISAEVVANTLTRQQNYLILNKGSRDGVRTDMGVITAAGPVGVVASVSPHYCRVVSLLHNRSRTSVRLKPSQAVGSMAWEGADPTRTAVRDILQHIPVQVGDTVCTSGYSTFYPQDLPIGVVDKVQSNKGVYYALDVRLFQDFSALRHVYVAAAPHAAELRSLMPEKDE